MASMTAAAATAAAAAAAESAVAFGAVRRQATLPGRVRKIDVSHHRRAAAMTPRQIVNCSSNGSSTEVVSAPEPGKAEPASGQAAASTSTSTSPGSGQTQLKIRRRPLNQPSGSNWNVLSVGREFSFRVECEDKPQNILEEIIWTKDIEVGTRKERVPLITLYKGLPSAPPARDFIGALRAAKEATGVPGLIAEVKKASPSRGVIRENFDAIQIAKEYEAGGAACISVLTDEKYFQGSFDYLLGIRNSGVECPLLCKDFVVDPYQILLARIHGADCILLIAAVLSDNDIQYYQKIAAGMGMASLVEVHTIEEMDRVLEISGVKMVGINNRDLSTFKVDIHNTCDILKGRRGEIVKEKGILMVGESGLFTPDDVKVVVEAGVGAVLVGESLVKNDDCAAGVEALFGKNIAGWRSSAAPSS